jgi:hypothetical protein
MVKHVERVQLGLLEESKCTMPAIYAFCGLEETTALTEAQGNSIQDSGSKVCDEALQDPHDTTGKCFVQSKNNFASVKGKPLTDNNYKCLLCVQKHLRNEEKEPKDGMKRMNFADVDCTQSQLLHVCDMQAVTVRPLCYLLLTAHPMLEHVRDH